MICHITVRTSKLKESVEFYEWLLKLPVSRRFSTPTGEIVFLGNNETKLELIEDNSIEAINAKGITIGFLVFDLDAKIKMLESKEIPHSPVISPSPNLRFVFFTDINGCEIQLLQEN